MKTIIAGSRSITDYELLEQVIKDSGIDITEVISGTAKGVDTLGELYAEKNGMTPTRFPAKWKDLKSEPLCIKINAYGKYNALAGFARNQKMANYADACIILMTKESNGSLDMKKRAIKANLVLYIEVV